MHSCKVFFFCVVLLASARAKGRVSLSSDKDVVDLEDQVTFRCKVKDMQQEEVVQWVKVVDTLEPIPIGTNGLLGDTFKGENMKLTANVGGNPTIFTLSISAAKASHTGIYRCSLMSGDEAAEVSLDVIYNFIPDSLSLAVGVNGSVPEEVVTDGEVKSLVVGTEVDLMCKVTGVYPQPQLTLIIGKVHQVSNLTRQEHFEVTDASIGAAVHSFDLTKRLTKNVTHDMYDKVAKCTALLPGSAPITKSFTIKTDAEPPKLQCEPVVDCPLYTFDLTLTCNLTSNPWVTEVRVTLDHHPEDSSPYDIISSSMKQEVAEEGYIFSVSKEKGHVQFRIPQVFKQHFRNYTFSAISPAGNNSQIVSLVEGTHATSVVLKADKEDVDVGDRVTFTCEVTDMMPGMFLRWQRVHEDIEPISLATNKYLETIFEGTGRFSTTGPVDQTSNPLIFSLTINSAGTIDSGTYRCGVLGGPKDDFQDKSINVVRDVKDESVAFSYTKEGASMEVTDGEQLKYKPGELLNVTCKVSQVFPMPQVFLSLGEERLDDSLLTSEPKHHSKVTDEQLGEVEEWYTVTKSYSVPVSYDHAGKAVSCSASVLDRPMVVRGFMIKMDATPPRISCDTTLVALERDYDVRIQCNVTSRPAITSFQVEYFRNHEKTEANKEVLREGDTEGNLYLETSRDKSTVSLMFSQVFLQHFRNYTFTVANPAGNASATVRFTRAEAVQAQYSVNVELSKQYAFIGDDVEVTCSVLQERNDEVMIVWVKKVDDEEVEIGTNNYVNNDFKKGGRYSGQVDYEYDDNNEMDLSKVSFQLNIKGVQPQDSGEIGCRIPQQKIEVFRKFTVFVPVKSILLNSADVDGTHAQSYNDGTEKTFDEGHISKFYCHVNGSFPRPEVAITIGDRDITDQFVREDKVLKKGFVKGLEDLSYAVTLKNEAFSIDYSFSNKRLECKATLPGSGFPAKTTGINIKLAGYKPKFVCNKTMVVRYLQEDVHIKCRVHADPEIDQFRIYWAPMSQNIGNITLEGNSSDGLYHAHVENGSTSTEKIMTLKIDRIFKQHFRTYFFEAGNELGKESHEIELVRDPDTESIDNKDDNDDEGDSDGTDGGKGIDMADPVHGAASAVGNSLMAALLLPLLAWRLARSSSC